MKPGETTQNRPIPEAAQAPEDLLPLVYDELRKLATNRLACQSGTMTLQPTALVHEAWLRLAVPGTPTWKSRAHFFGAAAEAMKLILIDRAREKKSFKRGVQPTRIDLNEVDLAVTVDDDSLLRVNDALEELARVDHQCAQLIKLRFYVGLDYQEAAQAMGISERTAKRYWTFGRAWLYRQLNYSSGRTA